MKGHKFVTVSTDDLLNGTGIIVNLDIKTDKIVICRNMKELTIFPYAEEDVLEQ